MKIVTSGFGTLQSLFSRRSMLPTLPSAVIQLGHEIMVNEPSTDYIEWLLSSEPELLACFQQLCLAHEIEPGQAHPSWIRPAILLIGVDAVRRFTLAYWVLRTLWMQPSHCLYNPTKAERSTNRVGLLCECLFNGEAVVANGREPGRQYASVVLREIPLAILAHVAPGVYNRVHLQAAKAGVGLPEAFETIFGQPLSQLGRTAWEAWGLPSTYTRLTVVQGGLAAVRPAAAEALKAA